MTEATRVTPSRMTARSAVPHGTRRQFLHDARGKAGVVNVSRFVAQARVEPVFLEVFVHVLVRSPRGQRAFQFFPASQHIRFHSAKWNLQNARCFIMR